MTVQYHRAAPWELEGQFRAASDGSSIFEGYTAIYNQRSKMIVDDLSRPNAFGKPTPYAEMLKDGTFRRTLGSGRRHTLVVDHDDDKMISSTRGQLRMVEDSKGLHVESPWPRTDYADNVRGLYEAGERLGMSVYFATPRGGESWNDNYTMRTVTEGILKHASVLATQEPAYDGTVATFRALADELEADMDDLEALFEALRSGRPLDDAEQNLLTKLTAARTAESSESAAPAAEETIDETAPELSESVRALLSKIDADFPQS